MECQQNLMDPLRKIQRPKIGKMRLPKTVKIDEPDGSLAWGVAFAACLINFIMAGLGRMSGILYVAFIEMFGVTRGQAMTPFSVRSSTRNLLGPVVGILGQQYGVRAVSVMGGIIGVVSSATCFFAPDMTWITVIWGGINGVGTALTTTLPQVTIGQYFKKYHTTAAGLAFSGGCVGAFLFPALIEYLLHIYGLQGTFLIMSAITMHVIPASMILKKPPWMKSRNNSRASVPAVETADASAKTNGIKANGVIQVNDTGKENGIPKENYVIIESDVSLRNLENNQENHTTTSIPKSLSFKNNEPLFSDTLSEAIKFLSTSFKNSSNNFNQFNNSTFNNDLPYSASILNFLYKLYNSEENQNTIGHCESENVENGHPSETPQLKSHEDVIENSVLEFKKNQTMEEFFLYLHDNKSKLLNSQSLECLQIVMLDIIAQVEHRKLESENGHVLSLDENIPVINYGNEIKNSGFMEHIKTAIRLNSNPIFHLICLCRTIHFISFIPVVTVAVDFAMDKGFPEEDGKFIIAALSAGDLIGRLGLGWVTDKGYIVLPKYMLLFMIVQGATTATIPFVDTKWAFFAIIGVFGMLQGSLFIRHPVLVSTYMGTHEQPIAMGCINFLSGFVGFGLPAYIGYFRDTLGSYDHMFHITGALGISVGFVWIFEPQFTRWIANRRKADSTEV